MLRAAVEHVVDKRMSLRVIVVTTRAALLSHADEAEAIRHRSDALLADLESETIRNGADPELLRDIEAARHTLWDGATAES